MGSTTWKQGFAFQLVELEDSIDPHTTPMPIPASTCPASTYPVNARPRPTEQVTYADTTWAQSSIMRLLEKVWIRAIRFWDYMVCGVAIQQTVCSARRKEGVIRISGRCRAR
jgi:hypothetical protein